MTEVIKFGESRQATDDVNLFWYFPMNAPREQLNLSNQLNLICDIWFNRQSNQPSEAAAAYTVLAETSKAYDVSEPVITNLLTPRLGLTRSGQLTNVQDLEQLAIQRLKAVQEGAPLGHYEVDNALRCAYMVVENGQLISDSLELQVMDAIQPSVQLLQEPVKRFDGA
jgi:hypothetical protein